MIKHIVFWRFKEEALGQQKAANIARVTERLEALRGVVPTLRELEVGADFNRSPAAFDLALYTVFETREDLDSYQTHPEHVAVRDLIGEVVSDRAVVDYEI